MGSGASKGKRYQDSCHYGELYLQTDKTTYQPGDTVTGTIHLDMESQYPGHQLFLKLKGREIVHLLRNLPGHKYTDSKESETKDIIKQNTLVHSWETSSTPVGQFSIPFSFLLPSHLPASFHQFEFQFLAFIEYQLEVFLQPPNEDIPKIKYKQPITIRESPLPADVDLHIETITALKSCFCCNQGSNILKASFQKNLYAHEEKVIIEVKLDNSNSKLRARQFNFSLLQKLEIKAQGETISFAYNKASQVYYNFSKGKNIPSPHLSITVPRFQSESDHKIEFDKYNPEKLDLIRGPNGHGVLTMPTKSSLISSKFYLQVCCLMDGVDPSLPTLEFPISILAPDSQPHIEVTPPPNWKPQILDKVDCIFSEYQYQQQTEGNGNMMEIQAMPGGVASLNQVIVGVNN